jgi:release factor glutamine methyltransferase
MIAKQALALAAVQLREAGIEDPARDARILLAHAMGIAPDRLTLHLPDEMTAPQRTAYESAITARLNRQPVSQITGQRLFWGRSFRVTPDTLDPRPDTEALVAEALTQPFARVLDLGTGTGCILLTLLAERPQATGLGTDIAPATLAVAVDNAARLSLSDRAAFLHSDWLAGVTGRFDLIVSNPPYIAADEMPGLAPEVRDHEPHRALTDFGDGLGAYRLLATATPAHLTPGGRLLLEIGPTQGQAVSALLAAQGFSAIRVLPDMDGRDRVVSAIAP